MKICGGSQGEAGAEKGDNSSCVTSQQEAALSLATGWAAMTPEDMEVVVSKIISLLVLTMLSVLAGLLPLRLLLHFPQLFTHHRHTADYFLRGLRCLSGGVFLATGFLHLLPDTRDKMAAVLINLGSRTKYAVTELLIMGGLFLVVFVEQIIKCLYLKAEQSDERRAKKTNTASTNMDLLTLSNGLDGGCGSTGGGRGSYSGGGSGGGGGGGGGNGVCWSNTNSLGRYQYRYSNGDKAMVIPSTLDDSCLDLTDGKPDNVSGLGADADCCDGYAEGEVSGDGTVTKAEAGACFPSSPPSPPPFSGPKVPAFSSSPDEHDSDSVLSDTLMKEEHSAFMDPAHARLDLDPDPDPDPDRDPDHDCHLHHHHQHQHRARLGSNSHGMRPWNSLPELGVRRVVKQLSQADLTRRAHFRSLVYILALSLHGILAGLALGLQSRQTSVWSLCFALCLHRCVLAFQLGMDLCGARESQGTAFLCIGTFTLIAALGIVAGILFSSGALLYADVSVPEAILQSLATGTILYIVFFDILFKDLQGVGDLRRVSSCFVGFVLMAVILAITTR